MCSLESSVSVTSPIVSILLSMRICGKAPPSPLLRCKRAGRSTQRLHSTAQCAAAQRRRPDSVHSRLVDAQSPGLDGSQLILTQLNSTQLNSTLLTTQPLQRYRLHRRRPHPHSLRDRHARWRKAVARSCASRGGAGAVDGADADSFSLALLAPRCGCGRLK